MTDFDPNPAADVLLEIRRTGARRRTSGDVPPADRGAGPRGAGRGRRRLGPVVAWKVGAPGPAAPPNRAPLHAGTVSEAETLPASRFAVIGAEAEIAYRLGRDCRAENGPYDGRRCWRRSRRCTRRSRSPTPASPPSAPQTR